MTEPTTQAGKRLLRALLDDAAPAVHGPSAMLAIEAEARELERRSYASSQVIRADLAARIIATVEKVPVTVVFDEPVTRLDLTEYHREVIDAIREEAER